MVGVEGHQRVTSRRSSRTRRTRWGSERMQQGRGHSVRSMPYRGCDDTKATQPSSQHHRLELHRRCARRRLSNPQHFSECTTRSVRKRRLPTRCVQQGYARLPSSPRPIRKLVPRPQRLRKWTRMDRCAGTGRWVRRDARSGGLYAHDGRAVNARVHRSVAKRLKRSVCGQRAAGGSRRGEARVCVIIRGTARGTHLATAACAVAPSEAPVGRDHGTNG